MPIINWGEQVGKYHVFQPTDLSQINFDKVIISVQRTDYVNQIKSQIYDMGIDDSRVVSLIDDRELRNDFFASINRYDEDTDPRVQWLKAFSIYANDEIKEGNVAECGVNRGEFAEYINKFFPNRTLYMFDTFDGFDEKDVETERKLGDEKFIKGGFNDTHRFHGTDVEIIKRRMPHLDKCVIKKGYFPNTASGLEDTFCFVSLDMDLYQPMYAGLEYFYPRMLHNGVILMHDYFCDELPGVRRSIQDYEQKNEMKLTYFPIGDYISIAIIK